MAPRDVNVGDKNDAAAVPVEGADQPIIASPEAAETGGAKLIRTRHGDVFIYDREANDKDANKGVVGGAWREFAATEAKNVIELARRNNVRIAVADKKG